MEESVLNSAGKKSPIRGILLNDEKKQKKNKRISWGKAEVKLIG